MQTRDKTQRRGFTLIEVLIVVVILGILAATVLPQFTAASDDARQSALDTNLRTLQTQIQLYQAEHDGRFPLADGDGAGDLHAALTQTTDLDGTPNPDGQFGPYIQGQFPNNPFNSLNTVDESADLSDLSTFEGDGSHGWAYDPNTGRIQPDHNGFTPDVGDDGGGGGGA